MDNPEPISYQPKINLQRFQEFLQEEEKKSIEQDPPSLVSQFNNRQGCRPSANENNHSTRKGSALNPELLASLLAQNSKDGAPALQDKQILNLLFSALSSELPYYQSSQKKENIFFRY